jgi:Na+/melibiose symporter-like transporter
MSSRSLGRNFHRLWTAAAVSNLGDGLRLVAFPLLAATITRDPKLVAGLTVALRLPWLLFSIPAGELADRVDRRRLMAFVSGFQGAVMALFALALWAGGARLALLYVVAFFLGIGEVTFDTAAQTMIPATVDQQDLERANGRLVATERIVNDLLGPPAGSFLFGAVAAAPFVIDALSFGVAAVLILTITGTFKAFAVPTGSAPHHRMLDGLRWVWSHRLFRSLTVFGAVWNFMGGAVASILVLFALETLRTGEVGFGLLMAALAVGGITGGLLAPWLHARIGPGTLMLSASALQGLAYGTAGLLSSPWWAGLTLAIGQVGFFATLVDFFSLRQAIVPDYLLGRVTAAMRLIGAGALPIGAAFGGVIAGLLGLRAPFLLAASGFLLVSIFGASTINNASIAAEQARQPNPGLADESGRGA